MAKFLLILFIGLAIQLAVLASASHFELDKDQASEFLNEGRPAIQKRLFYTGKEQRREAKENYEEKCERSALSKMLNKPRWCPDLSLWPEWVQATREDGNRKSNQYELFK